MRRFGLALVATGGLACSSFAGSEPAAPGDAGVAETGSADAAPRSAYAEAVLSDAPVLYWRLGDRATGTFSDSSSAGAIVGTPNGPGVLSAESLIAGDPDPSIRLSEGASVRAEPSAALDFTGTTAFSVECWVKLKTQPTKTTVIVARASDPNDVLSGYALFMQPDGKAYFVRREASDGVMVASDTSLTLDVPHHLVGIYTGSRVELWVDGVDHGFSNNSVALASHATAFHIGRDETNAPVLDAFVDEVAVYPRTLPDDRVRDHYQAGAAPK